VFFSWLNSSVRERLGFSMFLDSNLDAELVVVDGFTLTSVSTSIFSSLSFKGTVNSVCASTFTPSAGMVVTVVIVASLSVFDSLGLTIIFSFFDKNDEHEKIYIMKDKR